MHHDDLTNEQKARLHIYQVITNDDPVASLDPFDLLRSAHWIATGADPTGPPTDAEDTTKPELDDPTGDRATPWRPAVNN